jgi:hypothetical protein
MNNIISYSKTISSIRENNNLFYYKMLPNNQESVNKIYICNLIRKIDNYKSHFFICNNYKHITMGELNNRLETTDIIDDNYVLLLSYQNISHIPLNSYIFSLTTPKSVLFNILFTYNHLLKSILKLQQTNICFFNLSFDTIVFQPYCQLPFLKEFQNSIDISKLNISNITHSIENITEYIHKPLEVYIMFYLLKNNLSVLTCDLLEDITEYYINNCSILLFFSPKFKIDFKNQCILFMKKYINCSKTDIINDLLLYAKTWDNYSLSYLYLHIIGTFYKVFKPFMTLKNNFINNFIGLLANNIHPNPLKRNNVENTSQYYVELVNTTTNWNFIHLLPIEHMNEFCVMLSN